jgi:SAM-dependent methyltransferase
MGHVRFTLGRRSREQAATARGCFDAPATATLSPGLVRFEGWALEGNSAPAGVDVVFNGTTQVPARLGIDRPDVPASLREPKVAPACGWSVTIDLGQFPPGRLEAEVIVRGASGTPASLGARVYDLVGGSAGTSEHELPSPRWEWELPEFLAQTADEVSRQISPRERMPAADVDAYFAVGRSALKAIRLAQIASGKPDFASILDMPCGHGRVLRWLKAAYPGAKLTACDILADGADFCAESLGATPVYSSPFPEAATFADRYDLIFVGSLLTHVDVHQWDHLISLWHTLLTPDGLLVVTTHGELVAERLRAGHLYGYPQAAVTRTLRTYAHAGFAFLEEPPDNIDYGITIARPDWTLSRLLRHADFRVVMAGEALWDRHQDVTAVVKRPFSLS